MDRLILEQISCVFEDCELRKALIYINSQLVGAPTTQGGRRFDSYQPHQYYEGFQEKSCNPFLVYVSGIHLPAKLLRTLPSPALHFRKAAPNKKPAIFITGSLRHQAGISCLPISAPLRINIPAGPVDLLAQGAPLVRRHPAASLIRIRAASAILPLLVRRLAAPRFILRRRRRATVAAAVVRHTVGTCRGAHHCRQQQ